MRDRTIPIIRQLFKHEGLRKCKICQEEEEKSKTLKLQRTSLIERVILPKNECWICNLKFDNTNNQIKHFSLIHECDSCQGFFDNSKAKKRHVCEWKLHPNSQASNLFDI